MDSTKLWLGEALSRLRLARGLRARDVVARAGLSSEAQLSRLENDRIPRVQFYQVQDVLEAIGCDLADLEAERRRLADSDSDGDSEFRSLADIIQPSVNYIYQNAPNSMDELSHLSPVCRVFHRIMSGFGVPGRSILINYYGGRNDATPASAHSPSLPGPSAGTN